MKQKRVANVVPMHEQFPFKNSPQSLTLESEIKRIAGEREESIDQTIKKLADLSGVSERQIYVTFCQSQQCSVESMTKKIALV